MNSVVNLRRLIGGNLKILLGLEFFFTILTLGEFMSRNIDMSSPKFYRTLAFFISLLTPLFRLLMMFPIAYQGYFSWNFWDKYTSTLISNKGKPLCFTYPTQPLYGKIAHQTIIALIITFLSSLFITILPTSMKYISQTPPKSIKDFLKYCFFFLALTSSISLSSMIYSLQFFWKNIALTWIINILLLIFPIGTILFFICAYIFRF